MISPARRPSAMETFAQHRDEILRRIDQALEHTRELDKAQLDSLVHAIDATADARKAQPEQSQRILEEVLAAVVRDRDSRLQNEFDALKQHVAAELDAARTAYSNDKLIAKIDEQARAARENARDLDDLRHTVNLKEQTLQTSYKQFDDTRKTAENLQCEAVDARELKAATAHSANVNAGRFRDRAHRLEAHRDELQEEVARLAAQVSDYEQKLRFVTEDSGHLYTQHELTERHASEAYDYFCEVELRAAWHFIDIAEKVDFGYEDVLMEPDITNTEMFDYGSDEFYEWIRELTETITTMAVDARRARSLEVDLDQAWAMIHDFARTLG